MSKDYADQLIIESRNNVNHRASGARLMPCPNRWKLGKKWEYADPSRYEEKKARKFSECPSGEDGRVNMIVIENGIWTKIKCPICGYIELWSVGDGDDLF